MTAKYRFAINPEEDDSWRSHAACAGDNPDDWFPRGIQGRGGTPTADREWEVAAECVARECPVMAECLDFAVATGQREGVWGAKAFSDDRWRVRFLRERAQAS